MPSDPPHTSGGPGDRAPSSTTGKLQKMVADDALLAAFERSRWPGRGPSSDIALVLAAPVTWMLAGHVAVAVASVVAITALLLISAWLWLRGEGRDARVVLILSRWAVVAFVACGCLAALGPATERPHSPAPTQPAVRPATHAGVAPVMR